MPQTRASVENDDDRLELRALRQETNENRKDTDLLLTEVSLIKADLQVMNSKQHDVVEAVTTTHSTIGNISNQLNQMSLAINSLPVLQLLLSQFNKGIQLCKCHKNRPPFNSHNKIHQANSWKRSSNDCYKNKRRPSTLIW
jgi:hypothetical protein